MIAGYDDGRFGGEDPITREQTVAILWRYSGSTQAVAGQDFTDESSISAYAAQAVDWSRANGVVSGNPDGSFNPRGHITRAQIAQVLYQYLKSDTPSGDAPQVFMTTDISPEGLMSIYEALNWTPTGKVAVKLSTGEPPASNYLRPELIKDVVQAVNGTIVECNTAYGGQRSSTAMHYQVAKDHGFTDIADVVILDENGSMSLPVAGGSNLTENLVGEHFADYDSYLVLSRFKGHAMAGFGGAIKNISIGLVYAQKDGDGASLVNRIESRNGLHTLEHAEEIGLGSRSYDLVSIDK